MLTDTTSRRVLIGLAVVLGINSQINTRHLKWVGTVPNAVVKTFTNPPASLLRRVVVGVRGEQEVTPELLETLTEDERVEQYANTVRENRRLWEENNRLQRQLDAYRAAAAVRGSMTPRFVDAMISDTNLNRANPTLELDQGSRAGIQEGNPVVVAENLLGFIHGDVGALRSSVRLAGGPDAQYQVRLLAPGAGIPAEDEPVLVRADPSGAFFYCDLPDGGHDVRVGDLASMADDLYHEAYGYILGKVTEVRDDHPDNPLVYDRIIIRSNIDPSRQRDVVVQVEE